MTVSEFMNKYGLWIILAFAIVIIAYLLYVYLRPKPTTPAPGHECLTADSQQKITDAINSKLKEIDACNCKDQCKINS